MARSTQEQLDACDAKIAAIEGGAQAYTSRGLAVTHAQLETLYKQRERLEQKLSEENSNSGSMSSVGQIDAPT